MIDPGKITSTPAFVLDYEAFMRNLKFIATLQRDVPVTFLFALKGFAMHAVFPELAACAKGATVSSLNEALLASPFFDDIHAYAPVYLDKEFDSIATSASHITFNSLAQYAKHKEHCNHLSVGLRINPLYSTVDTALYDPCAPGSRLGVLPEQLKTLPEGVKGLHCHNLCESGAQELVQTLVAIEERFGHLLDDLEWLNLGGGHLVTSKGYDLELFSTVLEVFSLRHPNLRLYVEPGAAFVWETGYLATRILDIVQNGGIKTLMLDSSFAAHMPDCLEMPYSPKVEGATLDESGTYRLGGCTCLAGDWVGTYRFEHEPKVGDLLLLCDMMHYTMVKTTMFNGISHPDIAIYRDGMYQIVKTFGFDDYQRRMS